MLKKKKKGCRCLTKIVLAQDFFSSPTSVMYLVILSFFVGRSLEAVLASKQSFPMFNCENMRKMLSTGKSSFFLLFLLLASLSKK